MWALPLLLYLLTSCHGYNLHRHRHADFSKVGLPTEYVESVPNELKRLLPAKTESEYRIIEHANYDELATVTECSNSDYCGAGRTCLVDRHGEELCVCQGAGSCPPGHRLVCGSDGNMYDSHCELHRRACVTQKHISVDLDGSACSGNDLQKSSQSKKKDLSLSPHTPPTKSLRATTTMMRTTETGNSYKYDKSCSHTQFGEFKHLLMIYHCNRLGIAKCDSQNKSGKQHVVSRMFQYYDRDSNNKISLEELIYAQKSDNLNRLAHICSLRDLIIYSPMASPTLSSIDRKTFYHEFEVDIGDEGEEGDIDPPGDDSMITYVTADGYTGVELPCQLTNSQQIVWRRNGVEIEFDTSNSMSVLSNKDLFISAVNLDHTGNYTCYDIGRPHVVITRQLVVKVKPVVRTNKVGHILEGASTSLKCHADGVPQPTTEWQVGQYKVPHDTQRYEWSKGNGTLTILSPSGQIDSGDYTCIGKSVTAWSTSTTNLGILPLDLYLQDDVKSKGTYLVFHESGYTAYEPEHCFTKHSVDKHAADFISNLQEPSNTLDSLCSYEDGCDWGVAINVDNKYVYVSQPSLYRILVINVRDNLRPQHVMPLKHKPTSIAYMEETDELWVLVGNQYQFQTVMILSDASKGPYMPLTSLLPHHSIFDAVEELFVPRLTAFNTTSRYAFSSHFDQHGLSRLDTATMTYNGALDLTEWKCKVLQLHYLAIGGLALAQCEHGNFNLLLDTVINSVVSKFQSGELYVSHNTRYIVAVEKPSTLTVYYLNDNATLVEMYKHVLHMSIGEVRFMNSEEAESYNLAVTSLDGNSLIFFDVKIRKNTVLEGLASGREDNSASDVGAPASNLVVVSGEFGEHILVPCRGSLFIVNKFYQMISCEWSNVNKYQLALWLDI